VREDFQFIDVFGANLSGKKIAFRAEEEDEMLQLEKDI